MTATLPAPGASLCDPAAATATCGRCHGPALRGAAECWCCRKVGAALGERPGDGPPVVVLGVCRPGDPLHRALRRYKDAPAVDARRHYRRLLAATVDLVLGRSDVAGGLVSRCDGVVLVPSSTRPSLGGRATCPLAAVASCSSVLRDLPQVALAAGSADCGHLAASVEAFAAGADAGGRRLLVLDDTWVTGAHARSAAAALSEARAEVVAIVVIGRLIDPEASKAAASWWEARSEVAYRSHGGGRDLAVRVAREKDNGR